ncbi:hypothetical protein B0H13DRAFT_1598279 [Mycena leptocephala]|nr:hypothetical protein B0H13DRAFT_1598279 [Mycena leptocephala]
MTVVKLVYDPSAAEAASANATELARQGLPCTLEPTADVFRGSLNQQTSIYPSVLKPLPTNYPPVPYPPVLKSLVLSGVQSTHRALILNFSTLFLMVQYLTHTSVQWYTRARWEDAIMLVSKHVRKFHIGMAIVFADYVLTFVTLDLLFQPTWATQISEFDIPPSILTSPARFISTVIKWIETENIFAGHKSKLACDAIRDANHVWYGIGVYTVMELFFLAGSFLLYNESRALTKVYSGLSPFLTVWELKLLRPCIHEGFLAPTTEQRLKYANWLHVWGKERVLVSDRMSNLIDMFHETLNQSEEGGLPVSRNSLDSLYDVFEPTLIAGTLKRHPEFGPLIFGQEEWLSLGGVVQMHDDALTAFYRQNDLLRVSTKLHPNFYSPIFLSASELNRAHRNTFTFHGNKEMWSITRNFPPTLLARPPKIVPITGSARQAMLFKHIVQNTQSVSIGPLEYCGNGHVVRVGTGYL